MSPREEGREKNDNNTFARNNISNHRRRKNDGGAMVQRSEVVEFANGKLLLNSHAILSGGALSLSTTRSKEAHNHQNVVSNDPSVAILRKVATNSPNDCQSRHVLQFSTVTEPVVSSFVCTARCKLWWMSPAWGKDLGKDLPAETQYLMLELGENGRSGYVCILPLSGDKFRATLSGFHPMWEKRGSFLVVESACEEVKSDGIDNVAILSWASNPYDASKKAIKMASLVLKESFKPREEKVTPPVADVFGWCTWDAFYEKVSPKRIGRGLTSLQNGNSPPKFVIIDDGWQNVEPDKEYRTSRTSTGTSKENSREHSRNDEDREKDDDDEDDDDDDDDDEAQAPLTTPTVKPPGYFAAWFYAFYWRRLHAMRAHGVFWHTLRILINYVLYAFVAMKTASLSYFNHRVVSIRANKKFSTFTGFRRGSFSGKRSPFGSLASLAGKAGKKMQKKMQKAIKTVGSLEFLDKMSPPGSPRIQHSRNSLDSLRSADQQMDLAGHEKNKLRGEIDGLGNVVRAIKKKYDVDYVYCWHALLGYWGGVHPDEENVREFGAKLKYPRHNPSLLAVEPSQAWDPLTVCGVGVPAPEKMQHFYTELHEYLSAAGVDGVKVDAQAVIGALGYGNGPNGGGPALARSTHEALENSVMKFFPNNGLINCMCHSTENLYNFKTSNLARVSDDFYPTNQASHTVHIVNVAYNSMFMGEIVIPDWDMFQSASSTGGLHAAARAVGGCPIYVSDHPDKHDFNVLGQLVMPSGSILRGKFPGRPTRDCLFKDVCRDGKTALKIWNRNSVGGVIGTFNVQGACWSREVNQYVSFGGSDGEPITACVRPRDIEGFRQQYGNSNDTNSQNSKGEKEEEISSGKESSGTNNNGLSTKDNIGDQMFAVRSHRTGSVDILRLHETVEVSLTRKDWDVFTITPVLESFRARRSAPDESIEEEGLTSAETSIPTTPEFTSPVKVKAPSTESSIESGAGTKNNNSNNTEKKTTQELIKKLKRANIRFACFGLSKMMNGNAVVQNCKLEKISGKSYRATVLLYKSCGRLACYSSEKPRKISATSRASNGRKHDVISWQFEEKSSMLFVDLGDIEDVFWTLFFEY